MLLALVLLEAILHALDVAWGPWSRMHWEELFNARAGVQLACGHWDAAPRLQYRNFCGGCTAEAVLAAPLFTRLGAVVPVWKAPLTAIHLGIVGAGALVARRASGPWAGVAFAALMLGAPGFYRELTHTGWGNHVESSLFPLVATLLLVAATHRRWLRPVLLPLAGAVAGLGLWFCQTSAWALPALALAAVLVGRWVAPLAAAGFPAGFSPWWWFFEDRPRAAEETVDWWLNLEPSPPLDLLDHLFGPYVRTGLWAMSDYGEPGWGPGLWWGALWGGALVGMGLLLRRRGGDWAARLLAPVGLATYLGVLVVRYDWWKWLPDVYVNEAFNLRYRAPIVPMLFLGLAAWAGRGKRAPAVLVAGLALYGLGQRATSWRLDRPGSGDLDVYQADGWPDRTVPTGEPRQQLVRKQGRPQDVKAALDFIAGHDDPLPACGWDHRFELGRRAGLALAVTQYADPYAPVDDSLPLLGDLVEQRVWAEGYAQALMKDDGTHDPAGLPEVLDALSARSAVMGSLVGSAAGRRAAESFRFDGDAGHQATLDRRVWNGVCEARGIAEVKHRTQGGEVPPQPLDERPDLVEAAGACADAPAFRFGRGLGRARYIGCDVPPDDPDEGAGYVLGCQLYRGR